jgi:ribosomal protein S27E
MNHADERARQIIGEQDRVMCPHADLIITRYTPAVPGPVASDVSWRCMTCGATGSWSGASRWEEHQHIRTWRNAPTDADTLESALEALESMERATLPDLSVPTPRGLQAVAITCEGCGTGYHVLAYPDQWTPVACGTCGAALPPPPPGAPPLVLVLDATEVRP